MNDIQRSARAPRRRHASRHDADARDDAVALERLRGLLVGPERTRIENIEKRTAVDARSVGDVLPEAIVSAQEKDEDGLGVAFEPPVTKAVTKVVTRNPELFGELLAPTIGAAVRKAVADALAAILERFNEALERSFSIRSLKWHLEAMRTGRPYAEVVLVRTMKYRVEQVFFVHTKTSLVLEHVVDGTVASPKPDQVAAMLGAIDSFAREAFGPLAPGAHLDKFNVGELMVWVSQDDLVTLAAVVRGVDSAEVADALRDARERLRLQYRALLDRFTGDAEPFAAARPELEALLRTERKPPPRRAHVWLALVALVVVAAGAALEWRAVERARALSAEHSRALAALASEPGIVVTTSDWSRARRRVAGLADPLATPPAKILERRGVGGAVTEFTPFISLDPSIVRRRVDRVLAPPPTVTFALHDGILEATGVAPRAWIVEARSVARSLPGVERYDDHALRSTEAVDERRTALRAVAASLEAIAVPFDTSRSELGAAADAEVRRAAALIARSEEIASEARLGACIEVVGHTDPRGTTDRNQSLSDERAAAVAARLAALGVDRAHLREHGRGEWDAPGALARSVSFKVEEIPPEGACGAVR